VGFTRRDTLLGVLPQFHSFGLTVTTLVPLTIGARAVYSARFLPRTIIKLIREHRPTHFVAIPSMYNALLAAKDAGPADFTSFRLLASGGEPLPQTVASRFKERFQAILHEGYGLTETAPVTNMCLPHEYRPGSVGLPFPGVEERIVDPATGRPLPQGQEGEVQIKGPNVMQGYYHLPAETAAGFTPDGFLRTGDMGRFDQDGHLYITGRIKEMLIIGGENVSPREIEDVLDRHPSVSASGVVGRQDSMRGEVPVAFVELNEGQEFDAQGLRSWCRENLAGYKVPDEIRYMEKLPRNPTGKIMRRELKALLQ
jgi:long-chain acyl-CoA synthetase